MSQITLRGARHPATHAATCKKYHELRTREYLHEEEVDKLLQIAKKHSRTPIRDQAMILICYRHGLRVSQLCSLKWSQVDLVNYTITIKRKKQGNKTWKLKHTDIHPLKGDEVRILRKLQRENNTPYVFTSNREVAMSHNNFAKMIEKYGEIANLGIGKLHPHMLRHACGFKLVSDDVNLRVIQEYLSHSNINNTVEYTKLVNNEKFEELWDGK